MHVSVAVDFFTHYLFNSPNPKDVGSNISYHMFAYKKASSMHVKVAGRSAILVVLLKNDWNSPIAIWLIHSWALQTEWIDCASFVSFVWGRSGFRVMKGSIRDWSCVCDKRMLVISAIISHKGQDWFTEEEGVCESACLYDCYLLSVFLTALSHTIWFHCQLCLWPSSVF